MGGVRGFRGGGQVGVEMGEENPSALITFGVLPTYPAVGYGYIHRGPEVARRQGIAVGRVLGFREKPSLELAEEYVASGEYLWNCGIFVWKAATVLRALREHRPALADAVDRIADAWEGT